jgi:hypothetical protein
VTYFDQSMEQFYALDASHAVVDNFGAATDIRRTSTSSASRPNSPFLMSYDPETVDMSTIVPGGNPTATVVGWWCRSWTRTRTWSSSGGLGTYGSPTQHENLTAATIDYVHGNAIEVDADSTLMISCRHMDEITKISRETGDIVWRWGGKHNEFTFIGDTLRFSHQHAIRRLPGGTVTLFDNGNFHPTQYSRAMEYQLDEVNKTATSVWEYRNSPDVYGGAMGYVQRLENGNTLISWGTGATALTEVRPDGQKTVEMTLPAGIFSYRGFRFPYDGNVAVEPEHAPGGLELSAASPNPSHGRANLTLTLAAPATVSLGIFDLSGREVRRGLDRVSLTAGVHALNVDLSGAPPGLYFCRVSAGRASETRKLLLTR